MRRLTGAPAERTFLHEVIQASGQDLLTCLQCGKCSGSCPIASDTVGGPRKAIAAILGGMKDEALKDPTWWYCVSCGTCATRCPVEINFYQVATALCQMAEKAGVAPSEPAIHRFEEHVFGIGAGSWPGTGSKDGHGCSICARANPLKTLLRA